MKELTDEKFYEKYGICREDVEQIVFENSEAYQIIKYTHR